MRVVLALTVVCTGLLAAGCGGTEDATQRFAREAVQAHVANDDAYDAGGVHCTGNPRPWFVERQATVVICAVRRTEGGCDWFRVELIPEATRVTTKIRLDAQNAGCVLPA